MWAKSKGEYFEWMQFEGLLQASLMLSTVCSVPLTTDAAVLAAFAMFVAVWARPVVAVGIAGKGQRQENTGCQDTLSGNKCYYGRGSHSVRLQGCEG
jgi:hypothetical protein